MQLEDLKNRFTFHPAVGDQPAKYEGIRNMLFAMSEVLVRECPESRELSLAITKLEEAGFWANASIARHENLGEK